MRISDFKVERWLNPRCNGVPHNLGSSCVNALTVKEFAELTGQKSEDLLNSIENLDLHYGDFQGLFRLKKAISKLYKNINPELILTSHGGTGANTMVMSAFAEPGKNVVVITPNYQQHYAFPKSIGVEVRELRMTKEDGWLPDLTRLKMLVDKNTCMITMANPCNPTGTYCGESILREIVRIADSVGAYILCDEIYRGLDNFYMPSIVDLYDKGICTSSMSKVFSMAGTRVGWVVTNRREDYEVLENWRSYNTICEGVFDEMIAAICLENKDKILERSRNIVNENRKIVNEWMKVQPHLKIYGDSHSSISFVNYDYDISSKEFGEKAYEAGILVCHGECFEEEKGFRLGYGWDKPEALKNSLEAFGNFLKTLSD
ncbi:aminotransferase class I/II-fold pyridoxal phosphate-dependent enzyme [Aminipila terrae]|uniref:Aminotransferase n=1 Tax=Aminipila terrae TaxID=2697030 RepID=A0A6P1MHE1_9FIRM|nr:aminotransferase class I/II-fold pyridoxal phosphate-dependent enzyme [Aminipila terrae]QHI73472.1 aminotransferase class I/II-fold pyridoxal phosphate-dependent enzyme [Aminipila terrae]